MQSFGTLLQTASGGGFSPSSIAGLRHWYRADSSVSQSGGTVTSWGDKAPGTPVALVPGAAVGPTLVTSGGPLGQPFFNFNGTTNRLQGNNYYTGSSTKDITNFVVVRYAVNANNNPEVAFELSDSIDTNPAGGVIAFAGGNTGSTKTVGVYATGNGATVGEGTNMIKRGSWDYLCVEGLNSASTQSVVTTSQGVTSATGTNTNNWLENVPMFFGGRGNGSIWMFGDMAEIISYDRKLTAPEKAQVISYVSSRYGL